MAEDARSPTMGANRVYSNEGGRKNECSSNKKSRKANRTTKKESLYDVCGQRKELLQLWRIWTLDKEL